MSMRCRCLVLFVSIKLSVFDLLIFFFLQSMIAVKRFFFVDAWRNKLNFIFFHSKALFGHHTHIRTINRKARIQCNEHTLTKSFPTDGCEWYCYGAAYYCSCGNWIQIQTKPNDRTVLYGDARWLQFSDSVWPAHFIHCFCEWIQLY